MARKFEDLPAFTNAMSKRVDPVVTKLVKAAATAAGRTAVEKTRADTGKARSNWIAQLNFANTQIRPPYAPGNKLGFGERGNAVAAMAQHRSVISQFNTTRHQSIFISNNLDYIGILNNGGPRVSPGAMAQQAVQAAQVAIKSERVLKSIVPRGASGFRRVGQGSIQV